MKVLVVNESPNGGTREIAEAIAALPDQAALHGALARVRDLDLVLASVRALDDDATPAQPTVHAGAGREA